MCGLCVCVFEWCVCMWMMSGRYGHASSIASPKKRSKHKHIHTRTDGSDVVVPQVQLLQQRALTPLHRFLLPPITGAWGGDAVAEEGGQRRKARVADVVVAVPGMEGADDGSDNRGF